MGGSLIRDDATREDLNGHGKVSPSILIAQATADLIT